MDSDADLDLTSMPKLQLPLVPVTLQSPERSGTLTPPLCTSAAVPFRWEEEPGKPKPCTALTPYKKPNIGDRFADKCSELPVPPRLLLTDGDLSKLPSPTTVLDGPYVGKSSRLTTSSFRMDGECYGSFRKSLSPERDDEMGALIEVSKRTGRYRETKGVFGSWKKKGKREVGGGGYVFPSSVEREMMNDRRREGEGEGEGSSKITKITRSGSFHGLSMAKSSYFWATAYEGLKQVVVPWKSKKGKNDLN